MFDSKSIIGNCGCQNFGLNLFFRICFYISEGHSLGVQGFLEEFLSRWTFVDEQYVLVGTEENADYTEKCDGPFLLGVDKYLEVVEVYVLKLLGTILNDVDLASSWVENAKLPEDRRQVNNLRIICLILYHEN